MRPMLPIFAWGYLTGRRLVGAMRAWARAHQPESRVLVLAAAMPAVAIPLHVLSLGRDLPLPPLALPWWAIALGFLISESFSIELHVKGDAHSATFSEIPLLIGLAAASPTGLIVGRLLGSGVALVTRNGWRGPQLIFNPAPSYLDPAIGLMIYH